jgi:urea transport system substrate-binding protein
MRRWRLWWIGLGLAILVGVPLAWYGWSHLMGTDRPILVGILHSKTGPMAISEKSMIDGEVLAIKEINEQGGLLGGRRVEYVEADGQSDWPTYALEARRLIDQDKVKVVFGCWTSASRKSVKPIFESKNHLLIYPMAYEGLEQSPNIIYTGAAPNQQVIPTVNWCREVLKARRFYLIGSDYVWPHCVNAIIQDQLKALGAEHVDEDYILFGSTQVDAQIAKIKAAAPDVIISTVVGDTNKPFYQRLKQEGLGPSRIPVVSFSIAEDELRQLPVRDMIGDYSAWDYFQSIDREENHQFVKRFKAEFGEDRVTSDVIVAAYNSVKLWAQAVEEAGTDDTEEVRKSMRRQSLDAAEGIISVDFETQHTWRPVYIARVRADGQFDIVWKTDKPVRPLPYPFSRSKADWENYLDGLYQSWGGSWAKPSARAAETVAAPPS